MVVTAREVVACRMRNCRGAACIRLEAMERQYAREREASVVVPRFAVEGKHGHGNKRGSMSVDSLDSNAPIADVMNAASNRVWHTPTMWPKQLTAAETILFDL